MVSGLGRGHLWDPLCSPPPHSDNYEQDVTPQSLPWAQRSERTSGRFLTGRRGKARLSSGPPPAQAPSPRPPGKCRVTRATPGRSPGLCTCRPRAGGWLSHSARCRRALGESLIQQDLLPSVAHTPLFQCRLNPWAATGPHQTQTSTPIDIFRLKCKSS